MANTPMTATELQMWLKTRFPKEDEHHEWKEWRSLKSNVAGRKGGGIWCLTCRPCPIWTVAAS